MKKKQKKYRTACLHFPCGILSFEEFGEGTVPCATCDHVPDCQTAIARKLCEEKGIEYSEEIWKNNVIPLRDVHDYMPPCTHGFAFHNASGPKCPKKCAHYCRESECTTSSCEKFGNGECGGK